MLYQHQQDGADWLAARARAILGDTPGLGKTRTLLQALKQAGAQLPLVVCPASVRTHWAREARLMGMSIIPYSYNSVILGGFRLMRELLVQLRHPVDSLVIDEFHYCKNASAQRTKVLLGKDGYARRLERVYLASGTPISKNPHELWTTLSSCFPEVALAHGLKTSQDFINRFCVTYWDAARRELRFAPKLRNADEFRDILGEIMLRRKPTDVGLTLPEIWWQTVELDGGEIDEETSEAINDAADSDRPAELLFDKRYELARHAVGTAKAPLVVNWLLNELQAGNDKVVVFAYHRDVLNTLRDGLAPLGVCYIDGSTSQKRRAEQIDWFQGNPEKRVFLGQIIACKEGIDLTAATRVVLVEPSWTAMDNVQAAHRVCRLTQRAAGCVAQFVSLAGTADERLISNHRREVALCEGALDGNSSVRQEVQEVRSR